MIELYLTGLSHGKNNPSGSGKIYLSNLLQLFSE